MVWWQESVRRLRRARENAADRPDDTAATIRALILTRQAPLQVAHPPLLARSHAHSVEVLPVFGRYRHDYAAINANRGQAVGSRLRTVILDT
jgi:hypothetical protein